MAKIIDTSFVKPVNFFVRQNKGLEIAVAKSIFSIDRYYESDIEEIHEIDAKIYRNGGTAVAGAVIGGVLTGGIGLLAGAAFGGRRKTQGTYFIRLKNGEHVAFEAKGAIAKHVSGLVQKKHMQGLASTNIRGDEIDANGDDK